VWRNALLQFFETSDPDEVESDTIAHTIIDALQHSNWVVRMMAVEVSAKLMKARSLVDGPLSGPLICAALKTVTDAGCDWSKSPFDVLDKLDPAVLQAHCDAIIAVATSCSDSQCAAMALDLLGKLDPGVLQAHRDAIMTIATSRSDRWRARKALQLMARLDPSYLKVHAAVTADALSTSSRDPGFEG